MNQKFDDSQKREYCQPLATTKLVEDSDEGLEFFIDSRSLKAVKSSLLTGNAQYFSVSPDIYYEVLFLSPHNFIHNYDTLNRDKFLCWKMRKHMTI